MKKFIIDYDNDVVLAVDAVPMANNTGWFGVDAVGNSHVKLVVDVFDTELDALELQLGEVIQQKNQIFLLEQRIMNRMLELIPMDNSENFVDIIG